MIKWECHRKDTILNQKTILIGGFIALIMGELEYIPKILNVYTVKTTSKIFTF